ncbi:hypothetical protein R6U77_10005 [Lysinibacillus louembei]|uniref:Uncharacterized protein n=1 Tax=Lysinibacillus louembei TaxID=1470088 RepID=A0ABZ0RPX3_9BACI|nr:hypothetical protein [Lysinibacillus louembei]WPK10269.1 hypothetical protein R6U77_10005 [Lysinibacillus louembei]
MINLNDLINIKNKKGGLLKDDVYDFFIENIECESDKIDKNQNRYEMWKFKLRLIDRDYRLTKNVLVYDEASVNDIGKNQLMYLIGLLDIDFDNLAIKESELKDFLMGKLKELKVVSTVYTKNGRNEVGWLYGMEDKEKALENFHRRNQEFKKLDEAVEKIEKVDEVSPNEAHQVLKNEVKVNEEKSTQANVNGTDDINYTDFIKFD